jgi:phenylacetic acid degradation operon negative regulatory protein
MRQAATLQRSGLLERNSTKPGDRLFRLTEQGRIHALGGRDPQTFWKRKWDGTWRLVVFDIPTGQNKQREKLRRHLKENGFGYLQDSVWITPDPLEELRDLLRGGTINVGSLVILEARPCSGESDSDIVAGAWDFKQLNAAYRHYLQVIQRRPSSRVQSEREATELLRWAETERRAWLNAVSRDPLLPAVLLPAGYLGQQAWNRRVQALADAGKLLRSFNTG